VAHPEIWRKKFTKEQSIREAQQSKKQAANSIGKAPKQHHDQGAEALGGIAQAQALSARLPIARRRPML
jgi:hypothetical protein